jgi:hypothetical protein
MKVKTYTDAYGTHIIGGQDVLMKAIASQKDIHFESTEQLHDFLNELDAVLVAKFKRKDNELYSEDWNISLIV